MELTEQLIDDFKHQGLFSEYLPSGFSISPVGGFDIFSIIPSEKSDNIEPYSFTMSNFSANDKRRLLYLPEVTNYIKLINYMVDQGIINEICDISSSDNHSFSHIIQTRDGETSFIKHEGDYDIVTNHLVINGAPQALQEDRNDDPSTYTDNVVEKLNRAQGAKGILLIDIANCYKSIYTHYLACIKLGLHMANEQYKLSKANMTLVDADYLRYVGLDEHVRLLNTNESSGILTGPRVSNYIAEAFLSRINIDIKQELESNPQIRYTDFVRYVDDYEFFIYDPKDVDAIINTVENVFSKYRLTINEYKTKFLTFPYYVVKNLKRLYDSYATGETITTEELIELFNDYFNLEKDGVKGAIRYLIKSIQEDTVFEDKKLYTTFLFNILVNDNRSLVKVCQLIIRDRDKLDIGNDHFLLIQRLLAQFIENKMDLECIWLIYLLKKLGCLELGNEIIDKLINSDNELAIIVLISEYGLSEEAMATVVATADSWILLYQLYFMDKLTPDEFKSRASINHNLPFYRQLKRKNFSFYRN